MSDVWSVRGVSPELRRHIVEAASRSGVTVAQWLDQAVAAAQDDVPPPPVDDVISAIDKCLLSLDRLERVRPSQRSG